MDLPTYTNIWRIEKRLYKLYDFRLPMPLPINWIAVFAGITIPYIVLLIAVGLPFNHNLVWLYVLPPGLLTWLSTRPVLESKRLPELVESQARYLTEPRTWVRLAPLSEKDQVVLSARVWRSRRPAKQAAPAKHPVPVSRPALPAARPGRQVGTLRPETVLKPTSVFRPELESRPQPQQKQRTRGQERARGQERVHNQERSRIAAPSQGQGQGPARRAPVLPPSRQFPTQGPVAIPPVPKPPERLDQPAHVMPDVVPPAAALLWPSGPSGPSGPAAPSRPAPASQPAAPSRPAASRPAPSRSAPPQSAPSRPASSQPVPSRGSANPDLEVSHDAPRRLRFATKAKPAEPAEAVRSAPPAEPTALAPTPPTALAPTPPSTPPAVRQAPGAPLTPPTGTVLDWPVPARPLRPAPSPADGEPEPVSEAAPVAEAPAVVPAETPVPETAEPAAPPMRHEAIHIEAVLAPPVPARAQPAPAPAPVPVPAVQEVTDPKRSAVPSIERALSGPSRNRASSASWGGKVKIITGNGAARGPGARDQEAQDRNRARLPIAEPRRILILGCTSGAGQSVTALMTASMLASLREHPVAAVDLHDGTLARYRAPSAWLEELLAGKPPQAIRPARPDGLHPSPKPSPARLDVVASREPLREGDAIKLAVQLNRHYPLTLLDPGAAALTRLLKVTDQLVVVVPANVDAAGALADTRDWLDNNGHADLAMQSVTVINGVSRRSLTDIENAESIARGRSRAIVRVPWDDMLPAAADNPSALRPQTRVAYTALAGVLVAGLAATPVRKKS